MSSSYSLDRGNIALHGCYDYHEDIHEMSKENFGFGILENLDDDDTYSAKEGMKEHAEIFFKLLKDVHNSILIHFTFLSPPQTCSLHNICS